jgi:hypothetical protein
MERGSAGERLGRRRFVQGVAHFEDLPCRGSLRNSMHAPETLYSEARGVDGKL